MTVLVFGVFDMFHPGHVYFLDSANKLGDLHICLADDDFVLNEKHKELTYKYQDRLEMIKKTFPNAIIYRGDSTIGRWSIFEDFIPDIIALGYDQNGLEDALKVLPKLKETQFINIHAFEPEIYSTTKLKIKNIN